ncbi:hypothetical protein FA13DRAFT_685016 [Coprinellus micaceus]|uniref:MYND-type domain-containing protein n=1 Tax=Coprinellus micaceus TaxID=71717 RepID=A0A4Y7T4A1_COPMI|nr:hypothetical protein FA13DRAFT_685016 [Coprinellus micaceus]
MTTHLMICRCNWADQKIRDLHCPGDQGPTGKLNQEDMISFRAVVRTVVDCIRFALSGMTTGKFRSLDESAAQHGSVKPWPWDLDDLFPSGNNADLMTTLTRWAAQGGGFYMFRLANSIANFYPSFIRTLVQDPKLEFALQRPLIDITTALDRYERDPNEAKQEKEGETSFTTAPLNIIFEFFYIVIPTLEFQYGLMVQSLAVIPVIARLRKMLPSFPAPPGWSSNIDAGCEGLLSTAKGKTGGDEGEEVGTLARTRRDPLEEALGELVVARKSGGCLNLECPQSADTYARLCSKCDVVRYCGPECQKQAWKAGIWSHKTLCKKIFVAREQLGPDAWRCFSRMASLEKSSPNS